MNWKKLIVLSSAAALTLGASTVNAQGHRGGGGGGMAHSSAMRSTGGRASSTRTGGNFNRERGEHGDRDRDHHHRGYYGGGYYGGGYYGGGYYGGGYYGGGFYGGGYPFFYGGGFGYPYYGYSYGYPYFGSSAALYYYGTNSGYRQPVYQGRAANGGSVVAQVQQRLSKSGYYHGSIDGVSGNGTRSAIRSYQRANGLRVDGQLNNEVLGRMGLG